MKEIETIEQSQLGEDVTHFWPGDTVKVMRCEGEL